MQRKVRFTPDTADKACFEKAARATVRAPWRILSDAASAGTCPAARFRGPCELGRCEIRERYWRKDFDMKAIRFLLALLVLAVPAAMSAQVRIAVRIGPPVLPVYEQPVCPGDGYLWTPGYWAWDDTVGDYYWVPGTWVMAPEVGFLWTPGYWGWGDGGYFWNEGFWGPTVGFYGGINYGFGYFGVGFGGGRWDNGHFFYNRAVMNINVTEIHNVYETKVEVNNTNRVSFNGGNGGVTARPRPEDEAAAKERHVGPIESQTEQARTARSNPQMRASANHGNPPVAATAKAGDFDHGVTAAHGAEGARSGAEAPRSETGGAAEPRTAVHPNDLPPIAHTASPNSGDSKADKKFQKEQDKLNAQQQKERDQMQAKQESEHQKKMNDTQKQQLEQKHQQQTQGLAQKHAAQQQSLQSRAPQPRAAPAPRPR